MRLIGLFCVALLLGAPLAAASPSIGPDAVNQIVQAIECREPNPVIACGELHWAWDVLCTVVHLAKGPSEWNDPCAGQPTL